MGLAISSNGEVGQSLFATLQQQTASGLGGDFWDVANGVWAAAPSAANRKITLTAGTGQNVGSWIGGTGKLGTYSGLVIVRVHDANQADYVIGQDQVRVYAGDETFPATTDDVASVVTVLGATLTVIANDVASIKSDVVTLTTRLSAARGGYLDNLSAGAVAQQTTLSAVQATLTTTAGDAAAAKADAATLVGRVTATRAAYIDNLSGGPVSTATNLATLTATVATVATDVASAKADASTLVARVTSTRAGYWDNLSAGAVAQQTTLSAVQATLTTAAADVSAAKADAATLVARITAPRAGYLDNLSGGAVALQTTVASISNSVRAKLQAPISAEIPASGSVSYDLHLMLYDANGNMEDADATPTFTAANASGTDRSANIGTVTRVAQGEYKAAYTVASTSAAEQIVLKAAITENSLPLTAIATFVVAAAGTSSGGFVSSDRTKLDAIFAKLPSKSYLAGTALSDGDIDLAEMVGDRGPFKADVSLLATTAQLNTLSAHGDATWSTATGFLSTNDARLANLDATISSRSAFNPGFTVASASQIAELQSWGDTHWTTATGFLTTNDARLNNLDATISSRSTFNVSTQSVTLSAGHGLATASELALVKAKTNLIPTSPASTNDIPSAATVATQTVGAIQTAFGAGPYTQAGGDATLAKQDQILSAVLAIVPSPVSPASVTGPRTWRLRQTGEGAVANNIVTISTAEVVDVAMEFDSRLNPDSTITSVVSVTVLEGAAVTITNLLPSGDRTAAHFRVTSTTAGLRRLQVKVSTSDGQTLTGRGFLEVA